MVWGEREGAVSVVRGEGVLRMVGGEGEEEVSVVRWGGGCKYGQRGEGEGDVRVVRREWGAVRMVRL